MRPGRATEARVTQADVALAADNSIDVVDRLGHEFMAAGPL